MTALIPSQFNFWDIYHLLNVQQMDPPKDKFVIVVDVVGHNFRSLIVGSDYPPYVHRKPGLKPFYATILKSEHGFLKRDSLADCTKVFTFGAADLAGAQLVGRTSLVCAEDVQRAAGLPGYLPPRTAALITSLPLP